MYENGKLDSTEEFGILIDLVVLAKFISFKSCQGINFNDITHTFSMMCHILLHDSFFVGVNKTVLPNAGIPASRVIKRRETKKEQCQQNKYPDKDATTSTLLYQ